MPSDPTGEPRRDSAAPADATPASAPVHRRRLLTAAGGIGLAAGLGLAAWRIGDEDRGAADRDAAGLQALWALRLDRPEGGELALDSLRGRPLLINFWATWCPPCVRELPEFERFHQAQQGAGDPAQRVQVLGLAIDGPTPVREFLGRIKVSFPVALAGLDGSDLLRQLGNPQGALPYTLLLGADGRVRQRRLGETTLAQLQSWTQQR